MSDLPFAVFSSLPLSAIRPAGWLREFLQRQANGLTGHVAVAGYPYGHPFWSAREGDLRAAYDAWWPYEQTAYWIDGALKCGYLLGDEALYRQAADEVDQALQLAAPDGLIGPEFLRTRDRWPHAVFFRAVLAQVEAGSRPDYGEALIRHYRAVPHPLGWDRDVTGVEILVELFRLTGEADLLARAQDLYDRFNQQWPGHDAALTTLRSDKPPTEHGVTFNEIAKLAPLMYSATGRAEYLEAARHGFAKLDRVARLADGLHSCSEHIHGNTARDQHETCDITDHAWALHYLLQATGEAAYADQIEQVIYNALPGSITKDFRALQYFSSPNQVVADSHSNPSLFMRGLNWASFRPDHEVQCCPGNVHRAMPNFIAQMWQRTPTGGLVAACYGPGQVQLTTGVPATPVTITARTRYPYEASIQFEVTPDTPTTFAFWLRIPGWCRQATVTVNGTPVAGSAAAGSFVTLERCWQSGDRVRLDLPFELRLEHWPRGGVSLAYGPITLALPIPARAEVETVNSTTAQRQAVLENPVVPPAVPEQSDFPAWNLHPAAPWNYALAVDAAHLHELSVEWNPRCTDPLDAANPALVVHVPARRVRGWRLVHTRRARQFGHWQANGQLQRGIRTLAGDFYFTPDLPDPQTLPERLSPQVDRLALIPYAATLLRLTVFPHCDGLQAAAPAKG